MYKIYKDEADMNKNNEHEQKKMLKEYFESNLEFKKEKKKKLIKITILILSIFILFRIFIGEINLSSPVPLYKSRFYTVKLNSEPITIGIEEYRKTTIIPFMVYLVDGNVQTFFNGGESVKEIVFNKNDNIDILINSYKCFGSDENKETQISCKSSIDNKFTKRLTNDTKYTLFIKRINKPETVMYNGKYIKDIGSYFMEEGLYYIRITGKYSNIETNIYFWIKIV